MSSMDTTQDYSTQISDPNKWHEKGKTGDWKGVQVTIEQERNDTFWVTFIPKYIFRIFVSVVNMFYIRISAVSKPIYKYLIAVCYSTQRTFDNPLRTFRRFYVSCVLRNFLPYTLKQLEYRYI